MDAITYRKATKSDCLALARLKGEVWKTTYRGIYADESLDQYDVPKNQKIFESIVDDPGIQLYLAECGGVPVGLMTCGRLFKPYEDFQQEVGLLYILKEYQRQGIGKGFLDIAREQVRQNGYQAFLISVNSRNQAAIAFYTAMGGQLIHRDDRQCRLRFSVK